MTAITIQEHKAPLRVDEHQRQEVKEAIRIGSDDNSQEKQRQDAATIGSHNPMTFQHLFVNNRRFRLFCSSFVLARIGGWLTYIASITLIEDTLRLQGDSSKSAVSILVAVRFLPIVMLSPLGGALADGHDKRRSMIWLDIMGAACPLLFLVAMKNHSIPLVFAITLLQQSVTGLYEPCRSSMTPLLVCGEEELKTAITLLSLCWSVFAALGSSLGGLIVTSLGLRACFVVDCLTYLGSAALLWAMGGEFGASQQKKYDSVSLTGLIKDMTVDGVKYLRGSTWGALVFLKASGGIIGGAADILNVAFSEQSPRDDHALRLGGLFACIGVGSFIGSSIVNRSTNMKKPVAVQKAAIIGLALVVIGCFGTGLFDPFFSICFFTITRCVGSSLCWVSSSLLLQKFSAPEMLGRVSAVDGALALLSEASSALLCGFLQDHVVEKASGVALIMSTFGAFMVAIWTVYHASGGGAQAAAASDSKARRGKLEWCAEDTPLLLDPELAL